MRKRRMVMILAVVAMVMGVMAPASAGRGGVSKTSLYESGWSCFDNSGDGGAGWHCTKEDIGDFIAGGTGAINVMVFSSTNEEFLGPEVLLFSSQDKNGKPCGKDTTWFNLFGDLYACHHWVGGSAPAS